MISMMYKMKKNKKQNSVYYMLPFVTATGDTNIYCIIYAFAYINKDISRRMLRH